MSWAADVRPVTDNRHPIADPEQSTRSARLGLLSGVAAIVLWSFTAALVCLGADAMGVWAFLAVAALTGGGLQMGLRRAYHGELRSAVSLPSRLWAVTIFGFVLYGVIYPLAVALAGSEAERCGVNLINYLWPPLTVVCGVLWVPPTRFRPVLGLAIALALGGTVLANAGPIRAAWGDLGRADGVWTAASVLPYLLALIGAVVWAIYSSLLARWRRWCRHYNTSAIGLVMVGLIAGLVAFGTESGGSGLTGIGLLAAVLCGLGPQCGGYMLWELALVRADVKTLGLLGAMTPILSTLWLCLLLRFLPGYELILAAILVSGAVVLSTRS